MKKTIILFYFLSSAFLLHAQDIRDPRVVGVTALSSDIFSDSIASKDVYAAVTRVLAQTRRFIVLEVNEWKKTQDEIDRQKYANFTEQIIIEKGKILGAHVLAIGMIKNAEIYNDGSHYAARVAYEVKFVDITTGKTIAVASFTGDSESLGNAGSKISKGLSRLALPSMIRTNNWKTMPMASSGFSALSEADKNTIKGKLLDAIESTTGKLNAWIRSTFDFDLLFLKVLDQDKKNGVQSLLIEGGQDMGMVTGSRLKMVLVTITETTVGKIRDEEPIADLEIEEVRAQTSRCRVITGGKKIPDVVQNKHMRIIFN